MLTEDQKGYLKKIPTNKKARIYPFDKKVLKIVEEIIQSIENTYPDLEIKHMGASVLGIAGQKDLDIYVFSEPRNFDKYLPGFIKLFGKPKGKHKTFVEWNFTKEGYAIELYLTDPFSKSMQQQIKVFGVLKNNQKLLHQYEKLKKNMNGKSLKEYQEKKYEFFNRILKQ